jgi:hypothetical protein
MSFSFNRGAISALSRNCWSAEILLKTFSICSAFHGKSISDADVDGIYRTHFMPRKADARYSDMTESEPIYCCLGIILESIASSGGESDRGKNRNQEHDSVPVEQE